ncbi:hypothetical protein, partial [Endozoicomonas sp. ONNA1]
MPSIPKNIHVSIVGPAEGWEPGWLTIWAKVNPDYKIHVWAPEGLIYRKILYSLLSSERKKQTIEEDYPADITQFKNSIWKKIDDFMGKDADIKKLDIMKSSFSDYVKQEFSNQWNKTKRMLDQIQKSIANVTVNTLWNIDIESGSYIRRFLSVTSTLIIERFIGLYNQYKLGGIYIDKGLLPKLDSKPFLKRSSSLDPISGKGVSPWKQYLLESTKIRALFEKMFADGIVSDPATYFKTFDEALPEKESSLIKDIISESDISEIFHSLDGYEITRYTTNKIFLSKRIDFEDNIVSVALDDSIQPLMFASRIKNPVIKVMLDETLFIHETVEKLKKSAITTEESMLKLKEALHQFYNENKINISNNEFYKVTMMYHSYGSEEVDYHVIATLGYDAFERLRKIQTTNRPTINPTDEFSANVLFFNRKSYGNYSDGLVRKQKYKKLIMIHLSDNHEMERSFLRCLKLYEMYRTERTSTLYNVFNIDMTGKNKLETMVGIPLRNIGEDTKVIITGSLLFFDANLNTHAYLYSQDIVENLSSILRMAIPENTTVQSIAFSFDNSAQDISGSAGEVDTSHKYYVVPEVLKKLAQKGIRANSAVAIRGSVSAGDSQQTTGGDPDRPSTSKEAPYAELNRVVFTLKPDGLTVLFEAKFGLTSLAPSNEFTHARPEDPRSDTGFENPLFDITNEEDPGDISSEEDPDDVKSREEFVKALLEDRLIESGHRLNDGLPEAIIANEFTFAPIENALYEATIEEASKESKDPRKDAQDYALHFNFQDVISHGLQENAEPEKVAFVNWDVRETDRLSDTLTLARESSSYSQWLERYAHRFPAFNLVNQLEEEMVRFKSEEEKTRAFQTLQRRLRANSFDVYPLDPTTIEGAATLNAKYKNDFYNINFLTAQLPPPCDRRRRSADTNSCNARRKELANAIRLLSDANTQLYLR